MEYWLPNEIMERIDIIQFTSELEGIGKNLSIVRVSQPSKKKKPLTDPITHLKHVVDGKRLRN